MPIYAISSMRGGTGVSTIASHLSSLAAQNQKQSILICARDEAQRTLFFDGAGAAFAPDEVTLARLWSDETRVEENKHVAVLPGVTLPQLAGLAKTLEAENPTADVWIDIGAADVATLESMTTWSKVLCVLRPDTTALMDLQRSALQNGERWASGLYTCINQLDPRTELSRDIESLIMERWGDSCIGRVVFDASVLSAAAQNQLLTSNPVHSSQAVMDFVRLLEALVEADLGSSKKSPTLKSQFITAKSSAVVGG